LTIIKSIVNSEKNLRDLYVTAINAGQGYVPDLVILFYANVSLEETL
jgi:hypothetical protein